MSQTRPAAKTFPVIDRRVLQIGTSKLRIVDGKWLRQFNDNEEICVINAGPEPIAVMVPYKMYIEMQSALDGFNELISEEK